MRTAIVSFLILVVAGGHAAASRTGADLYSEGGEQVLIERSHTIEARVTGMIAVVTERQEIVAERAGSFEAVYRYALPADAAIIDLSIKLPGGRVAKGVIVSAEAAANDVKDPGAIEAKPDLALLRRVSWEDGVSDEDAAGKARYELRVYPVDAKGIEVKTTWMAPLRYQEGRLTLRIPGRGEGANLSPTKGLLEITAPSGAGGFHEIAVDGAVLGKNVGAAKQSLRFKPRSRDDVMVEAVPWFVDDEPRASFAQVAVDERSGALLVAVMAPPVKASARAGYERVLLVVDVSKSMQSTGVRAARDVSTALLSTVGGGARVEVVMFDRHARRVFGRWVENDREAERALALAFANVKPENGSDLGAALDLAATAFAEERKRKGASEEKGGAPRTLLVIMSDGIVPLSFDGSQARDRLGDELADDAFVVSTTIFPEGTTAPDPYDTATGELARLTGGRAFAIRDLDAAAAAKRLANEMIRPTPMTELVLATGTALVEGLQLPNELPPGNGFVAVARWRGQLPKELALGGYRGATPVAHKLVAGGTELVNAALPLWATRAEVNDLVGDGEGDSDEDGGSDEWQDARRRLLQIVERAKTVTAHSSFVAVDPDDAFARDRLALVTKWGGSVYQRVPPPPERVSGHAIRVERPDAPTAAARSRVPIVTIGRPSHSGGSLDKSTIRRPIRDAVLKPARACYERALRPNGTLAGSLDLMLELSSRGEVTVAWIEKSTLGVSALENCVVDAAYTMVVPVAMTGTTEISVVRYPLTFRVQNATVTDEERIRYDDPNDPLDGIP